MSRKPIVIIGSGLAGYTVIREFRKFDVETPVLILSADHGGFYSKPMLSNALATGKTPASLLNSSAEYMADQMKAMICPYSRVISIDPLNKNLVLQNGKKLNYDQLVLALGADQIRLPLEGNGIEEILSINDLDDYHRFRDALVIKKKIAILGAGLIGCEFANDLAVAGYRVHVIDISAHPLGRLLPQAGGIFLQRSLETAGVVFHMNTTTQRVDKSGEKLQLTFSSGETIKADILLTAVGLIPRIDLAKAAGIKVNRGIVVNRLLKTSYEDVYALGDCAEVDGRILPFVMPIMHAARALAATLANKPTQARYPAMPVLVKTPSCPTVVSPPNPGAKGEWQIKESQDGVKALFQDVKGKLLGYALLGTATKEKNLLTKQLPPVME
jgi:rubredoxin-NAD+ reductase